MVWQKTQKPSHLNKGSFAWLRCALLFTLASRPLSESPDLSRGFVVGGGGGCAAALLRVKKLLFFRFR